MAERSFAEEVKKLQLGAGETFAGEGILAVTKALLRSGALRRWVERFTSKGRVVQTSLLGGFLLLYTLAGLRHWRRGGLRYAAI